MLAQRLSNTGISFSIQAIDIDAGAVEQSLLNFAQSPWAEHLVSVRMALQEYQSTEKFDVIVSNPPYFQSSLKNPDQARATARHTDSLSYEELIRHAARLLAEHGTLALILPSEAEQEIIALAEEHSLYPTHITYVHSKPGKVAKRILIAFARSANSQLPITNTLYIESATSPRSKEYQELTNDFYL
jgi:tRNA1Val (adenine37-N6)-methyltransferase